MQKGKMPIIEVSNINISAKGRKRNLITNGKLSVMPGEIVILFGENGCGKSSVFKAIINDREKNSVSNSSLFMSCNVVFDGVEVTNDNNQEFLKNISYCSQKDVKESAFIPMSVKRFIDSNLMNVECDENYIGALMYKLGCENIANGKFLKQNIYTCSGGEQRLASLLRCFSRNKAKLYILDEPLNDLDAEHARILNNYIVDLTDKTNYSDDETVPGVLIITHCRIFQKGRGYEIKNNSITESIYEPRDCYNGEYIVKNGRFIKGGEQ